ncbi:MAG: hypothetical protein IKN11_09225 [Bacteroidales bacterium]|nr:hypothetical protein [Bacteroidales bacterium]
MFKQMIGRGLELVHIGLEQGNVAPDGTIDSSDTQYVTTAPIAGGGYFFLRLQAGFRAQYAHWYNEDGSLAQYRADLIGWAKVGGVPSYGCGRLYGFGLPRGFSARINIARDSATTPEAVTPSGSVAPGDMPVAEFYRVDPLYFRRDASRFAWHASARYRLQSLMHPLYRLQRAMAGMETSDIKNKGKLWMGVPYGNVHWQGKVVGSNVSLYTFLTATHNKRSLFYTERPVSHVSGYGIEYPANAAAGLNDANTNWFGVVCHDITNYALNTAKTFIEKDWKTSPQVFGMTAVTVTSAEDCQGLQPLDIVQKPDSHIYIVVDVWRDAGGTVRFIEVAEAGAYNSHCRFNLTTPEQFYDRLTGYGMNVYRSTLSGYHFEPDNRLPVEQTPFIHHSLDDIPETIAYNDDICTFEGDRASFAVGGKVFVNVHRQGSRWDSLRLLRRVEDEELVFRDSFEGYTLATPDNGKTMLLPPGWRRIHDYVTIAAEYAPMLYYNAERASSQPYTLILNKSCMTVMPRIEADVSKLQMTLHLNITTPSRTLRIGVVSDPDDYTTFQPVATVDSSSLPADGMVTVDFQSYTGDGHYIAFHNVKASVSDYSIFYLDDVTLRLRQGQSDPAAGQVYEFVEKVDIASLPSSDTDPDTEGREDWVDVDLSGRFAGKATAGRYRATAYNSLTGAESRPTDFELLYVQLLGDALTFGNSSSSENPKCTHLDFECSGNVSLLRAFREGKDGTPFSGPDETFISPEQRALGIAALSGTMSTDSVRMGLYARGAFGNDVKVSAPRAVKTNKTPLSSFTDTDKYIDTDGTLQQASGYKVSGMVAVSEGIYRLCFARDRRTARVLRMNTYASTSDTTPLRTVELCNAADIAEGLYTQHPVSIAEGENYVRLTVGSNDTNVTFSWVGEGANVSQLEGLNDNHQINF